MNFWRRRSKHKRPVAEHVMQWRDDEIPRYPPFMKGLPCVSPKQLLESQNELINRIANTAITTPELFKRYYLTSIERFAQYAHLLPASQSHHHRGAGGLLRHSIEVGLWALQAADRVLLDTASTPFQRREMEPRWQLAVFLAGLCHDAGKPVTDITVTNKDRSSIWKPIKEDLYAWATKNSIKAYFLDWREGRARQHTALSNLIADRIIGLETLEWIEEGGTELVVWLMESLNYNPSPTNLIHDIVIKADQTSVERDLKTMGMALAGYDIGVPVERYLTDIMRRFVREGVWLVNEPGARLWNIGGNIFLVWPAAGEEIAKQVREDGIPGIPRTPDSILDMLVERQIAFIREGATTDDRLWKIAPTILAEKIPDIKLTSIRLRDEAMVSSVPIPQVDGMVVNEHENTRSQPAGQTVVEREEDVCDAPAQPSGAMAAQSTGAEAGAVGSGEAMATTQCVSAATSMDGVQIDAQTHQSAAHAASGHDARSPGNSAPLKGKSTPVMQAGASKPAASETKGARQHNSDKQTIILDGPVGEALKALAQDLKSGDKKWDVDVLIDSDKHVVLRWPDAFSGYGLTPKSILDELSRRKWLWADPMAPLKKVTEAEFGGKVEKALRLTQEVGQMLIRDAGLAPDVSRIEAQVKLPPIEAARRDPVVPENSPAQQHPEKSKYDSEAAKVAATAQSSDAQTANTPANVDEETPERDDGYRAAAAGSSAQISIEDVIEATKALQATVQTDGHLLINKQDVLAACRIRGLRVTYGVLMMLERKYPDRLSVGEGVVRIKI